MKNKKPKVLVEINNRFYIDLFLKIKLPHLPVSPHAEFFSLPACRSHQHFGTHVVGEAHWSAVDIDHGQAGVAFSKTSLRSIETVF